jgi:quercetin dioxygenase-like cupin family protein
VNAALVRAEDVRISVTPNATMTTLSSPSLSGSAHSLWRTSMEPGQRGPLHSFDVEQIWTVLAGTPRIVVEGREYLLSVGDTLRISAGAMRQVIADEAATFVVCGDGAARATTANGESVAPPWIV